jgi:hypothetical protein
VQLRLAPVKWVLNPLLVSQLLDYIEQVKSVFTSRLPDEDSVLDQASALKKVGLPARW